MDIITKPILTEENYYSDTYYLSSSRFKGYLDCPLRQMMVDLGFWSSETNSEAFLVGNYVHSYFESAQAHEKFVADNQSAIISSSGRTKGQLKKAFKAADGMIKALEKEPLFNRIYHGSADDVVSKEKIITGELGEIPFKCKIDSLNLSGGYFVDLKTMESLQKEVFSPRLHRYTKQALYNMLEYRYDLQFYVYQQLLKQELGYELTPYMMAVSKEPVPDKELFEISEALLESGKELFEENSAFIKAILSGEVYPDGCGHCDYCLSHKSLEHAITLEEFAQR